MNSKIILSLSLAAMLTAGCFGNGAMIPQPEWLVDAEQARALTGGVPLNMTSEELSTLDENLVKTSDSLIYSGLFRMGPDSPGYVLGSDCSGSTCKVGLPARTIDLEDFIFDLDYQAIADYEGIALGQVRERLWTSSGDLVEIYGYAGWLDYTGFALQVDFLPSRVTPEQIRLSSYTYGTATGTNPASGGGTWNGVAIGIDLNALFNDPAILQGKATISIDDFNDPTVDVNLADFINLNTGELSDFSAAWSDLPLVDGAFFEGSFISGEQIEGRFHGPNHEEVGGVFKSDFKADSVVVGSFGAKQSM